MDSALNLFNILLPVLYGVCLFIYGWHFFRSEEATPAYPRFVLLGTLALHAVYVALIAVHHERAPMASLPEALTVLAFTVGLVYFFLEVKVKEVSAGLFIIVFAFLFQLFSSAFIDFGLAVVESPLSHRSIAVHVGISLFSYSALAISAVFSGMYLLLYRNLKAKRFGLMYDRLPSLGLLEKLFTQAILFGFILLTISVISGVAMLFAPTESAPDQGPKFLAVMLTWFIYGILTWQKTILRWQGPRLAVFSLAGFVATMCSLAIAFTGIS